MISAINNWGRERALAMFADWTDRIAAGEVPPAPPRPQGLERNVVITTWDWADPKAYLHDEVSTDRRNPTLNANGLIYGALELSADYLPVLDPVEHTIRRVPLTVRDPDTPPTSPNMPLVDFRQGGLRRIGSGRAAASGLLRRYGRPRTLISAGPGRAIRRTGNGTTSKVVKFQLRPDPLAK